MRELEKLKAELMVTRELLDRQMQRLISGRESPWWKRPEPNWLASEKALSWQLRPRPAWKRGALALPVVRLPSRW